MRAKSTIGSAGDDAVGATAAVAVRRSCGCSGVADCDCSTGDNLKGRYYFDASGKWHSTPAAAAVVRRRCGKRGATVEVDEGRSAVVGNSRRRCRCQNWKRRRGRLHRDEFGFERRVAADAAAALDGSFAAGSRAVAGDGDEDDDVGRRHRRRRNP